MSSSQNETRLLIVQTLTEMMQKTPLDNIKVVDICKECGISRKRFYTLFHDRYDIVHWFCEQIWVHVFPKYGIHPDIYTACCFMNYEHIKNRNFFKNAYKSEDLNSLKNRGIKLLEKTILEKVNVYYKGNITPQLLFQCHYSAIVIITSNCEWTIAGFNQSPEEYAKMQCSMLPDSIKVTFNNNFSIE